METTEATMVEASVPPIANDLERRTQAARAVLNNGYFLIALAPGSKHPFANTHWDRDSRNDELVMQKWNEGIPANPGIDLRKSNLTVLDIDQGLFNTEHAMQFIKTF